MAIYQDSPLVNGVIPISSGGTGSTTKNFVDLTTAQISIGGIKNFNANIGFGVSAPQNDVHIGVPFVANTGGLRLPITSSSPSQTGQPIGVNANGDIVRLAPTSFDATVSFNTITPTTNGVVFTPNTPESTTVLYVSSIDGSQWTYNGTQYVTQPVSDVWKTTGNSGTTVNNNFIGTIDSVGFNIKTSNINRISIGQGGNVGIGTNIPTAKVEINNGTAGSGLKFTQLNSSSTPVTASSTLGVDTAGNVVVRPNGVFMSVSGGLNQVIGAGFNNTIIMNTVVSAVGVPSANYNTTTGIYTIPVTGTYQITGNIRFADGQIANTQFGIGVNTVNSDGAWFNWSHINQTTSSSNRTSFPYVRIVSLTAGSLIRMYSSVDTGTLPVNLASMQVLLLF